ncbi:MAG: LytTR family DNA-binding domain-containing protein [Acidobacteriota bacterium]
MRVPARALVVDDEPLARQRLRSLLAGRDEVEWVGECRDGREAVRVLGELEPDLVFLDIQMPELDGFGVIEAVGIECMPEVVFVTAYDKYALDAFAAAALDFLLKPFEDERFEATLARALDRLRERRAAELGERLACLVDSRRLAHGGELPEAPRPLKRLAVERRGRIYFVPVTDIHWIEAEGAYVRLHTAEASHLVRDSLKRLEGALDPNRFVRIHRSTLVDIERVAELRPLFHGEYQVVLDSGAELKLSRSYRDRLPRLLEG